MPMLKLATLALCFYVPLLVLVWAARALGQSQPEPQSMVQMHLLDCAAPCWMGITPNVTTIAEAKAKLIDIFTDHRGLQIKDVGFADGPVSETAVENMIEGDTFYLFIRFNISELVDGKSETVNSIDLFAPRDDREQYAPTVADVLGTLGAPQWVLVDDLMSVGDEITLKYEGLDVVFNVRNSSIFEEIPHFHLGRASNLPNSVEVRPWKGFGTLQP